MKEDIFERTMKETGRTQKLKDKVNKGLGIKTKPDELVLKDMYEFEYKKPDSKIRKWVILHGKCINKYQKELISWGYLFIQNRHFEHSDKTWCRVQCASCKQLLDEKETKNFLSKRKLRLKQQHLDYIEEKAIRDEWEAEQILLGKL